MLVFDIESDGLLDTISKLHCINAIDRLTGQELRFTDHKYYQNVDGSTSKVKTPRDGDIEDGLEALCNADELGGHNIIGYDIPAIAIVYPSYVSALNLPYAQYDSKIASQLIYPDLKDKDWTNIRKGKMKIEDFMGYQVGSHSLYPWGLRLGGAAKSQFNPGDYGHSWATMPFTQDFDEYGMQDVRANVVLIKHLESKEYSQSALGLEMAVAKIMCWQERNGMAFDYPAAEKLAQTLYATQYELEQECREVFPPFYRKKGRLSIAKKSMRRWVDLEGGALTHPKDDERVGYYEFLTADAERQPIELVEFNPGSRQHIARCLTHKYGWEPSEFTPKGLPKIDEEILDALPFGEAKKIAEYMTVTKRLSQLCEGKQAWMKKVHDDGRIYGRVNQLGTITGRMAHYGPNLAQVPTVDHPYGRECRSLFVSDPGRTLVGCDADALELRVLAHFMARFDKGAYIEIVLNGSKEDGTDMHTRNQEAMGLESRYIAKTYFYAMLYGSGNFNLGTIVLTDWSAEKLTRFYMKFPPGKKRAAKIAAIGKLSRSKLMVCLPALSKLITAIGKASRRGYLKGIDGRVIPVRSLHAALNALCQSAGAVIMKRALVIMFDDFAHEGLDVRPLLNIHDEVQLSAQLEQANDVGRVAAASIEKAGIEYSFRCPLGGDFRVGNNWADTH